MTCTALSAQPGAAEALARAGTYRWLARWFLAPPDAAMMASLRWSDVQELLGDGWVVPADDAVTETAVLWTRLFSAPGPDQVPPYESVYRDKLVLDLPDYPEFDYRGGRVELSGQLYGDSTVHTLLLYAEADFALDPAWGTLGDHIGVELAFMALTGAAAAAAAAAGDPAGVACWAGRQRRFLRDHLGVWLPQFAARLAAKAPESLYARLAAVTAAFVAAEAEVMAAG